MRQQRSRRFRACCIVKTRRRHLRDRADDEDKKGKNEAKRVHGCPFMVKANGRLHFAMKKSFRHASSR
jgi:hypothetical protein